MEEGDVPTGALNFFGNNDISEVCGVRNWGVLVDAREWYLRWMELVVL